MTVRLGLLFSFIYFLSPPSLLLYYGPLPLPLDTVLSWIYSLIPRLEQDASRTVHPPPLSITCPTLTLTVPSTRASVPADVHPLCPFCARISSLSPYVSLHLCARCLVRFNMCNTMPLVRVLVV